ncbi:DUF192 domain-containing protein [Acidobacteriota bacterium]
MLRRQSFVLLLAVVSVVSLGFCAKNKFIQVFLPNGKAVTSELAITDSERARGLMFREKINPDQGMLFVFEKEGRQSFWMKNMVISIDILWLNKEKQIVHIEERVPPCKEDPCPSYASKIPAMYVLELKAGSVQENNLKPFDRLNFVL